MLFLVCKRIEKLTICRRNHSSGLPFFYFPFVRLFPPDDNASSVVGALASVSLEQRPAVAEGRCEGRVNVQS